MPSKRLTAVAAIVVAGVTSVGALSTVSVRAAPETPKINTADQCFNASFVRNFMMPDSRRMIVIAGGNKVYELSLFSACMNIEDATQIAIRTRGSSTICQGFDATIIYSDMGRRQECIVNDVRRLSPEEASQYVSNPR